METPGWKGGVWPKCPKTYMFHIVFLYLTKITTCSNSVRKPRGNTRKPRGTPPLKYPRDPAGTAAGTPLNPHRHQNEPFGTPVNNTRRSMSEDCKKFVAMYCCNLLGVPETTLTFIDHCATSNLLHRVSTTVVTHWQHAGSWRQATTCATCRPHSSQGFASGTGIPSTSRAHQSSH